MGEPVPGYPRRPVPRDEDAAKALKKRTLTNLYNARPRWLVDAHAALDAAVAVAYSSSRTSRTKKFCANCRRSAAAGLSSIGGHMKKFGGYAEMRSAAAVLLAVGFAGYNGSPAASSEMPSLTVDVHATDSGMRLGSVLIEDTAEGARLTPNLSGLTAGEHGFHIHVNPDCGMAGQNAGGHYDPANTGRHEGPDGNGHLGDLPRLAVDGGGGATVPVVARRVQVSDVVGRSLMVHAGGDNNSDMPAALGGGGARVACGVIPATAS